ncbi:hypothetical protein M413DRAFT_441183 [Hebeloma cylindrosporum]|uniref:Uncharacterized protein n=1 Tax=Hebeloma cylindrosporum TaxID=76867 RepID=A0A0C2Y8H8_HEBCY|nr:hypothetical protein M413DRAFT_441183 [Hebeloma cylindrosporum h7]
MSLEEPKPLDLLTEAGRIDEPPGVDGGPRLYEPFSFPILALLAPAAVFGVLARVGLVALMTFEGKSVFQLAYVQGVGCLIMGIGLSLKAPLGAFYSPLFTALITGFCGSLTTFSNWQSDVFNAWINAGQFNRGGLRDFVDGVGISAITLSLSLASLAFGSSIGSALAHHIPHPQLLRPPFRYGLSCIAVLIYGATFLTYFLLPASYRHQATAALMFSFPGVLTRYALSITLNKRIKGLPVGTLMANTAGTALSATFHVLQRLDHPVSPKTCSLLQGLVDGYCGCLTTVSTFAAEVTDLGGRKGVRYVMISWVLGQAMLLLIFGSSIWTGQAREQMTCNFQ